MHAMELSAYFARIGFAGDPRPDLATLAALHRAHVTAIPFENLDVQLGCAPSLDPAAIFAKLVTARRGGWCYEQNGLFGRVLDALGFEVTRLAGGVMRQLRGEFAMGSHLCLKVRIAGEDYLADVGFGAGQLEPLPLRPGTWENPPLHASLGRTDDGLWRLGIDFGAQPLSYDFADRPADEALLARMCQWQASDAQSVFVQNLVVQQRGASEHLVLRGRVFTRTGPAGTAQRILAGPDELTEVLHAEFGLDVPEAAGLWDRICTRHTELFS